MNPVFNILSSALKSIPTASSWFEAYAALSTSLMLLQTATNQFVPVKVQSFIKARLKSYFFGLVAYNSCYVTITEIWEDMGRNELYDAVKEYLPSKISSANKNFRVGKLGGDNKKIAFAIGGGESIVDVFEDMKLTWIYSHQNEEDQLQQQQQPINRSSPEQPIPGPTQSDARPMYVLSFDDKHRDKVMESYLPHILNKYKDTKEGEKVLKHYTNRLRIGSWIPSVMEHPATFDTIAMESELKMAVQDDLDRFLSRKSFYKKLGRAWKRGYLLYGPPGTGKTSLIAAMANHLKYDVYALELSSVLSNADLMMLLRSTSNRSILAIEDIDCNKEVQDRSEEDGDLPLKQRSTLSGLLNFIDGVWSSCGDERIIVFTTNHKERLDPALLRPGRMDMHIHMSYCTTHGFKQLASTYLGIRGHQLFGEIESLLETARVTPAQVAEELMKSEHADIALQELTKLLKRKNLEGDEEEEDAAEKNTGIRDAKRRKLENKPRKSLRNIRGRGNRRRR